MKTDNNNPYEQSKQQIIDKLSSLPETRMLYNSGIHDGDSTRNLFIIIVDNDCLPLTTKLQNKIDKIFQKQPYSHRYKVYTVEYTARQLKDENLFFIYGLSKGSLKYHKPDLPYDYFPVKTVDEAMFSRVKKNLKHRFTKIGQLWNNAILNIENGDLYQASLLFHQYMEDLYRVVEITTMGQEKDTNSIREHQSYAKDIVGEIWFPSIENEQNVLDLFEEVYFTEAANYNIDMEQIGVIKSKAKWINYAARKAINSQYHAFEFKHLVPFPEIETKKVSLENPSTNIKAIEKDQLLEQVVELIKSTVDLHSVYLIGKNETVLSWESILHPLRKGEKLSGQFTLLIISYNSISNSLPSLVYKIYNKLSCEVCIVDYMYDEVIYKLDRGCSPLERFLTEAIPLFSEDSIFTSKKISRHYFESSWIKINKVWNARVKRAHYLLTILEDVYQEIDEDPSARIGVMHYAMEQICLGLLYVFWEFKPSCYKLPYLLQLCSNFTDLPNEYFSKNSHASHNMYHRLSYSHHKMRHKAKSTITKKQSEKAFNYCNNFYESARKVGNVELQRLKRLHCIEEVV